MSIKTVKWQPTIQESLLLNTIEEFLDQYRPKVIRTYVDENLKKEVKVLEPRYC